MRRFSSASSNTSPPARSQQPRRTASVTVPPQALYDAPPPTYEAAGVPSRHQAPAPVAAAGLPPPGPPPQVAPVASTAQPQRRNSVEDPLKSLQRYNLVFLIDDSPSMTPLWKQTREALKGVVQTAVKYDKDGIDCLFMNSMEELQNCTSASQVDNLFARIEPEGSTPTAMRLDDILRPYVDACEDAKNSRTAVPKPMVLICITDGEADDPDGVVDLIVEMAGRLDAARLPPFQLGIQLLQVGNDPDATDFLRRLDDDLKEQAGVRDICDTAAYTGEMNAAFILKVLLGSVNRRVDALAGRLERI